jgi:hypothetical protein
LAADLLTDEGLELLREIRDEVRGLRADLAPRWRTPTRADLGEHLRAIAAVVGGRIFSVAELLEHAAIPEGEALRAAIVALVGSTNGKRLGKFLRRIEGEEIAGLRVERVGEDRLGAAWVLRVSANPRCLWRGADPGPKIGADPSLRSRRP